MQNKKGNMAVIAIIIIIVAVTAGVLGWVFAKKTDNFQQAIDSKKLQPVTQQTAATQETNDIADWKTYTNSKYGFSFKYPQNLKVSGSDIAEDVKKTEVVDESVGHTLFNLVVSENPNAEVVNDGVGITVNKIEKEQYLFPKEPSEDKVFRKEMTIGGQRAMRYETEGLAYLENGKTVDAKNISFITSKGLYAYTISSFGSDPKNVSLVEQIAISFNFFDSIVENKSGLQEYRNDKYGFAISFPETWKNGPDFHWKEQLNEDFGYMSFSPQNTRFEIIQIGLYTREQWAGWKNKGDMFVLGQNDKYVFTFSENPDKITDDCSGGGQYNTFETERCKEIPQIIKTFRLTN